VAGAPRDCGDDRSQSKPEDHKISWEEFINFAELDDHVPSNAADWEQCGPAPPTAMRRCDFAHLIMLRSVLEMCSGVDIDIPVEALRPISKPKKKSNRTWNTNHEGKKTAGQVRLRVERCFHCRCPRTLF
jgi:hypothetical protein